MRVGWIVMAMLAASAFAAEPAPPATAAASPAAGSAAALTPAEVERLRQALPALETLQRETASRRREAMSAQERQAHYAHLTTAEKLAITVKLSLVGMAVVMLVLWLIAVATHYLRQWDAAAAPAQPAPATAAGPDDAEVAAITAAVAVAVGGRRFEVRRIQLRAQPASPWVQLGRQTIMTSHQLPRKS